MRGPKSHMGYSEYGLGADTEQAANILFGTSPGWEVKQENPTYPEIDQAAADILGLSTEPGARATTGTFSQKGQGQQGKVRSRTKAKKKQEQKKKTPDRTKSNNTRRSKTPKKRATDKKSSRSKPALKH